MPGRSKDPMRNVHLAPSLSPTQSFFGGVFSRIDEETGVLIVKLVQARTMERIRFVGILDALMSFFCKSDRALMKVEVKVT